MDGEHTEGRKNKVKAVMFVPYTPKSKLAVQLREAEEKLESLTGYRIKIVERAGQKLKDLLHSSNPWRGEDCGRKACLLCSTKQKLKKHLKQDCRKRSLVYEVWCQDCKERGEKEIEKEEGDNIEGIEEKKRKMKIFKYIGEKSRSVFERAAEHQIAFKIISNGSFMLKHWLEMHEEEEMATDRYCIKVVAIPRAPMRDRSWSLW